MMKADKKGKVTIRNGVPFGKNGCPITTGGLAYSPELATALKEQRVSQEKQEAALAVQRQQKEIQKAQKIMQAQACADEVKKVLSGTGVAGLNALPADTLRTGANILLCLGPRDKLTTKKAALEALQAYGQRAETTASMPAASPSPSHFNSPPTAPSSLSSAGL